MLICSIYVYIVIPFEAVYLIQKRYIKIMFVVSKSVQKGWYFFWDSIIIERLPILLYRSSHCYENLNVKYGTTWNEMQGNTNWHWLYCEATRYLYNSGRQVLARSNGGATFTYSAYDSWIHDVTHLLPKLGS